MGVRRDKKGRSKGVEKRKKQQLQTEGIGETGKTEARSLESENGAHLRELLSASVDGVEQVQNVIPAAFCSLEVRRCLHRKKRGKPKILLGILSHELKPGCSAFILPRICPQFASLKRITFAFHLCLSANFSFHVCSFVRERNGQETRRGKIVGSCWPTTVLTPLCCDSEAVVEMPRVEMDSDGHEELLPEKGAHMDDRVQYICKFLARKGVDFDRPCTFPVDGDCWLAGSLGPFNKILSPLGLEVVELQSATLCLRFNDLLPKRNTGVDALRRGAYLFTWLPKQHACVHSICLCEEISIFEFPVLELKRALRSSVHLRHFSLGGGLFKMTPDSERYLCDGMAALQMLETFELLEVGIASRNLARVIATLLRKSRRHLVTVRFSGNELSQRNAAVILRELSQCQHLSELSFDLNRLNKSNIEIMAVIVRSLRNLKKLSLDLSIYSNAPFGVLAKALESNASLEELSLQCCRSQVALLFEALHTNTTLKLLDLKYCKMNLNEVLCFATALSLNQSLRTVKLKECNLAKEGIAILANAIAINTTLEKLDLSGYWCSHQAVMVFCQSLKNTHIPRSVALHPLYATYEERIVLSHEMSQHNCHDRIVLRWEDEDLAPLTTALKADALSLQELDLDLLQHSDTLLCSLFDALASNTMVRTLKLKHGHYDCHLGYALRNALMYNRSIKVLRLESGRISPSSLFIFDVCKALLVNATVFQLSLLSEVIDIRTSKLFAEMLGRNRTLTWLTLDSDLLKAKRGEIISRGLFQNKTVTSLESYRLSRNRASLRIREVIARNLGFLHLAVKFVMRTNLTKRAAQAFEAVRSAPSLVSQLSHVTGKTEQEALTAIATANRYIRSHYLYITGVVQFSVKCHPSAQTQVDALNDYCWQAIAQFLTVSDVRDE
ncbi:hypothetical protein HPB51_011214 [Rhipicephalus microplus]|uniref:Ran gtpase-activating protein n=1 Tax=Rhipicephalus microplus TaxID=6941 RepID=A0A9J6F165_RHIMP|nr:hypothetical protein HPB51_011214 [Rhipicephalus microplus]